MITSNAAERAGVGVLPATVLTSAFFKGADIWMNAHGQILSAVEPIVTDWVRRQQAALDIWSRSLKQICQCRDPIDLIQAQQDWLCDTVRLGEGDIAPSARRPNAERAVSVMRRITEPDKVVSGSRRPKSSTIRRPTTNASTWTDRCGE